MTLGFRPERAARLTFDHAIPGAVIARLCHRVEPMCGDIDCRSPRRRLSRARITKIVSQFLKNVDSPEMKFCDLKPFIGPRTINDKVMHEPRSGLIVR